MNKVFANIDYIVGIKVYYEVLTDYEFHPETQDVIKTSFWGLYEKIVQFGKPARWLKPDHRDTEYNWLPDVEVREWKKTFRIQDHPKRLFKNPYIEIRYTNKDESKVYKTERKTHSSRSVDGM
jgi:hypothetical protein